nr:uncharacterized protein [Enterobacter cloacae subsp. cloacae]
MAEVGPAFNKIKLTLGEYIPAQTSVDTHRSGNLLYSELLFIHTIFKPSAAMRGMSPKKTALPSVSGSVPGRLRASYPESHPCGWLFFQKSGWSSAGNYLATRMMSASRQNSASFMYQNRWRRKTFC